MSFKVCLDGADVLPTASNFASAKSLNEPCADVSGTPFAHTLTENDQESSSPIGNRVKTIVCTQATIIKDEETDGKASCMYVQALMCTQFCNDDNVPMQYAASTGLYLDV